jgi:8-oxo-dGTP pyrophosphatase MutT (NUDIX family)
MENERIIRSRSNLIASGDAEVGPKESAEKLSRRLKQTSESVNANAAVVVLLRIKDGGLQVLLVKRAEKTDDPWSGQTALPGGKLSLEDRDLKQTVIRETFEETALNLLECCSFLGAIEPLRSIRRPELKIVPFVVLLEKEQPVNLNEELTGYFWTPLKELVEHRGTAKFSFWEYPAFIIGDNVIWGLTYRILKKLLSILEGG